jgi:hypothetical protein
MPIDKSRVEHTPCITIDAGEWYHYKGWEDFLCQGDIATWADQEELNRQRYNRENGYSKDPYIPGDGDNVFMWVEWDGEPDSKGRPGLSGDAPILEEYCPQAWDELVDILLELNWNYGVVRITNSSPTEG